MAMATRRSKRQQKRSPDPDTPPPSPPRRVKGAKKGAAGPSVLKDRSAHSKNDVSLSLTQLVKIVPAPAPAAKRKQAEAGADSEDDHVNKKARQTADSDDEHPAPALLRDTAKVGGDSQDTHIDKDSRHDTGDIQDEEGDVQDADEANAGTAAAVARCRVKEQKLQQLAKNPLLLSLQPPPQQQQVPVNATSKYQYQVSNGLVFSLQQQQGTSSFEPNTDAHRGRWVPPRREGAHDQADKEDPEVASRTGTPVPDNFTDTAHDSHDDDVIMPLDADDDDSDSDQSNFSTTHAATGEALRLKNRTITDNRWVATMDTREEEDLDLEEEYLQDVAKPKGKGKAVAVESSDGEEDPFPVASDDDEDEDKDKDKTPSSHITPWAVGPGALSSAHLKLARAARAAYHATLEDIARRAGKKMSTIFKAIGDYPKSIRDTNSWNAYQMKYRIEHLQPSRTLDIEVFGLALDCFGDNAIIWGGGTLFQEVFKQHPLPIRKFLIDMKGLFQTTSLYLRNQAETAAAPSMMQPVPITFTRLPTEASGRDALRRQLTALFVNQICLVMIERGELELEKIKTTFQKMLWKWANDACKHQLRIENWPAALKETYPGPGFTLGVITEKDNKKEEKRARMVPPPPMSHLLLGANKSSFATGTIHGYPDQCPAEHLDVQRRNGEVDPLPPGFEPRISLNLEAICESPDSPDRLSENQPDQALLSVRHWRQAQLSLLASLPPCHQVGWGRDGAGWGGGHRKKLELLDSADRLSENQPDQVAIIAALAAARLSLYHVANSVGEGGGGYGRDGAAGKRENAALHEGFI
ncbi:hypothetical protein B0H14DRAFT_2609465 [Mycena olivaceomarginata]|nr:hypothetical protein B0H14DRAFT_2609465 [Mycena olivaceomarginata]